MKVLAVIISANKPMEECIKSVLLNEIDYIVNIKVPEPFSEDAVINKYENCYRNRNEARERALKTNAENFLFLDDDIVIPKDSVKALLSHKKDIIGGWYKILNTDKYVCGKWVGDNKFLNYTGVHRGVVRTDTVGLGCALISRKALESIPFESGVNWDCIDASTGGPMILGECGIFGNRAYEKGFDMFMEDRVVCDHLPRIS